VECIGGKEIGVQNVEAHIDGQKKKSHDPYGNHAKHHQIFEGTHIECYKKDFHGDHMEIIKGLKKLI
jgi:hypothetical protein